MKLYPSPCYSGIVFVAALLSTFVALLPYCPLFVNADLKFIFCVIFGQ